MTEEINMGEGYEPGQMPTDEQIDNAIDTLVQICTITGQVSDVITRTTDAGELVGHYHFDMHDTRLCQDHGDMIVAEHVDKSKMN